MNTFWGCETEELTELSAVFGTRAVRLQTLIQQAASCVRAADWIGPDAEDHRIRTEDLVEFVIGLVERLRELGELLGDEAAEQDLCSQADGVPARAGDPLGVRATPPWVPDDLDLVPDLSRPGHDPMIGGPLMHPDPSRLVDLLPDLPDLGDLGPLIGGPLMHEDPIGLLPATGPLPEGEDFALDPETLAEAESHRKLLLGEVPGVGLAQTLMDDHAAIGDIFDHAETTLEENGYGAFAPALSLARMPHDISGGVLGEDSTLAQAFSSIDRGVANVMQTGDEVFSAVGDGDLAGAIQASERGVYRHAGMSADLLTITPVPAIADTASDLIGTGADVTEPFNPEMAETLRSAEQAAKEYGQAWERGQERLTEPETYYDLRRTYFPAPWDPQA
ncbi:MAG: hypothetical protein ACTHX0_10125 [Brachybacterium sp.]